MFCSVIVQLLSMTASVKSAAPAAANIDPHLSANTILVVAKKTGLSMDTLRAWERRYGFPRPERRPGSNRRLYSEADIQRLIAITKAIAGGYRVGDVITKSVVELDALIGAPFAPVVLSSSALSVEELISLLMNDDITRLEAALRHAASALPTKRFLIELAHPFAVRVGQAWAEGKLAVRHEHIATECLITQLRQMLATYGDVEGSPLVLLATLPGESHTLALQMVALYLAVSGAKARLLGGSTPAAQLADAAHAFGADVVGLTVTHAADKTATQKELKLLSKGLLGRTPIWVGGEGAKALTRLPDSAALVTSWESIDDALAKLRSKKRGRD